jgi:Ca2+-binding RTX toxin-like protein
MTHFTAYKVADFTKLPELLLLIQDPTYSAQSGTGFTATKGNLSLKVTGLDLDFVGGKPTDGTVTVLEGFSDGTLSFRIEMAGTTNPARDIGYLINRLEDDGLSVVLDVLFNVLSDDLIEGSAYGDKLFGFGGADVIEGNGGDDRLDGGYYDDGQTKGDVLDGGRGRDVLIGGKDDGDTKLVPDTFVFSVKAKTANADKVMDFRGGDEIHLDNAAYKALKHEGGLKAKYFAHDDAAKDRNDFAIYDRDSGKLFYDKDGDGGADQKLIAIFKGKPDIDHDDIFIV